MERTALVTGGLRGIGLGIVTALVAESYRVLVADLDSAEAGTRKTELPEGVEYVQADIADREARRALVARAHELFGAPHVLVNNAGVAPEKRTDILFAEEESYERVMRINLQGPYFLTQQVAHLMINARASHPDHHYCVVNISSSNAIAAAISRGEYCLSKAGVSMATKLWAGRCSSAIESGRGRAVTGVCDANQAARRRMRALFAPPDDRQH